MSNGCGGKGGIIKPPYAIFFKTSCDKHDDYYSKGGDWFDKIIADLYLLKFCICDSLRTGIRAPYYIIWSIFYFIGVLLFGWKFYNFK